MPKIIFIQGIKTSPKYQKYIQDKFKNLGLKYIDFPMYYDLYDYDKFFDLKKNIENEINNSESFDKFILVAHSMGGIVAMSLNQECYRKVSKIVTIASPHQVKTEYIKALKLKLNYINNLKNQFPQLEFFTCGFYLDNVVKRENTVYAGSIHKMFLADHGIVLFFTKFLFKKILKFAKINLIIEKN